MAARKTPKKTTNSSSTDRNGQTKAQKRSQVVIWDCGWLSEPRSESESPVSQAVSKCKPTGDSQLLDWSISPVRRSTVKKRARKLVLKETGVAASAGTNKVLHEGGVKALRFNDGPVRKVIKLRSRKMSSTPKPKEGKRWRTKCTKSTAKKKGLLSRLKISSSDITMSPAEKTKAKSGSSLDEVTVTVAKIVDITEDGVEMNCAPPACRPYKPHPVLRRGPRTKRPLTRMQNESDKHLSAGLATCTPNAESYSGKTNEFSKTGLIVENVEPLTLNQPNTPGLISNHEKLISPRVSKRGKQKVSVSNGADKNVIVEVSVNSDASPVPDINKTVAAGSCDPSKPRSLDVCTLPVPKAVLEHGERGEDGKCANSLNAVQHVRCDEESPAIPQCPNKSISLVLEPNEDCPAPDRNSPDQSNETWENIPVLSCVSNKLKAKTNFQQTLSAGIPVILDKERTQFREPKLCAAKRKNKPSTKTNKPFLVKEAPVKSPFLVDSYSGPGDKSESLEHDNFIFAKSLDGDISDSLVSTINAFESCFSKVDDCTILDSGDRVNISFTYALKNFEHEKLLMDYPSNEDSGTTLCFGGESYEAANTCISDQELENILEGIISQVEDKLASPKSTTASLLERQKCLPSVENMPNCSSHSMHVTLPSHSHHGKGFQLRISDRRATCFLPNRKRKICKISRGVKEEEVQQPPCKRLKLDYVCIDLENDSDITFMLPSPLTGRTLGATGSESRLDFAPEHSFSPEGYCDVSFSTPEHDLDQDEMKLSGDCSDKPATYVTVLPNTCPSYGDSSVAIKQMKSQGYKKMHVCSENIVGDCPECENNYVEPAGTGKSAIEPKVAGKGSSAEVAGNTSGEVAGTGKSKSAKILGSGKKKSSKTLQSESCFVAKSSPPTSRCKIYERKSCRTNNCEEITTEISQKNDVLNNFSETLVTERPVVCEMLAQSACRSRLTSPLVTSDSSHTNSIEEVITDQVCSLEDQSDQRRIEVESVYPASGAKTKKKKLKVKKSQRRINKSLDVTDGAGSYTPDVLNPEITLVDRLISCHASLSSASDTGSPKVIPSSCSTAGRKKRTVDSADVSEHITSTDFSPLLENINWNSQKRTIGKHKKCKPKEVDKKVSQAGLTNSASKNCAQRMVVIDAAVLPQASPGVLNLSASPGSFASPSHCISEEVEDVFSPGGLGEVQVSETIRKEAGINLKACVILDRVPTKKKIKIGNLILIRKGRVGNFYWRIKSKKVKSLDLSGKSDERCVIDTKSANHGHDCAADQKSSSDSEDIIQNNVYSVEHYSNVSENDQPVVSATRSADIVQHVISPMPERALSPETETTENNFSNSPIVRTNTVCDFEIVKGLQRKRGKSSKKKSPKNKFPRKKSPKKTTPKKNTQVLTDFELAISKPVSEGKKKKSKEAAKRSRRKSSEESNPGENCLKLKRKQDIDENNPVITGVIPTCRFSAPVKSKIAQNILRKKAEDELEKTKPQQFEVDKPLSFLEILHGNPLKENNDLSAKCDAVNVSASGENVPTLELEQSEGGNAPTQKMVTVVNMVPDLPLPSSPLSLEIDLDCNYSGQTEEIFFSNFMRPNNVWHPKQTKLLPKITKSDSSASKEQSAVPNGCKVKPFASSTLSTRKLTFGSAKGSKQSVLFGKGEVLKSKKTVSKEKVLQAFEDVLEEMDFTPVYELDSDEESVQSTMGGLSTCSSPETAVLMLPKPATISFGNSQPSCKPPLLGMKENSLNQSQGPFISLLNVSSSNSSTYTALEEECWDMGNGNAAKADTCNQPWTMENPCPMQLNETEKGPSHCDNISDKYEDGRIMEDSDTDNCLEGPNEESVDIDRTYMTVDEADCGTSFLCATMDETGECEPSGRMCFGPADNTSLTEESGLVVGGTADIEELEECEDDEKSADVAVISSEGSSPAQGVKTGIDTDPTIEDILASVDTDPTIGDRLACVDTDPTIENRSASVDTDPTIEDRSASVDTDPTIENRSASVDTDPTIEGRLACVDTDPTIEGRLACVGTDPTIENRLASVDSDPTIEDRMAAEPDSHQAELTTSAKRMVQQNIPRSPVFPAREKTPKPRRKWMWQTREICYESSDSDDDDVVSILAPSEASFLQEEGDLSQPFWNEDVTDMDAFNNDIPDLATSQTTPPLTHSKLTSDQSPFRDFKIPVKTTKAVMGPPAKVPKSPITLGAVQSVVMGKIVKKSLLGEKAKVPPQVCPPEFFNFPNCFPPNHCIEYLLNGECKAGTGCKFQKHSFISKNDGVKMAIKGIEAYQKGELKNALLAYRSLMLLDVAPPPEGIILSLLHHCCKQGAAAEALAILTDICFGRYLRASMWTKLYQLFAEDKMKYREHISLLLKAMISFQLRPEHNCMLDILRCCMDGLLWEDLWKALTYCHEWFQVSLNMKTSALQALKNDPKHLLPLAAPWIKAQDVTSLTLIRKDLLRTLTSECHSLGLPICAQIFSKAFTASLDPRRDLASRYGKSALEGATDITCHEQISGLANSDSILSRIKGCGVTCNWLYLGELFVEVCQEGVNAFDPVLHKAFLDTLLKDQPAATTTTGYKTFVETALKAALTEDAQGCLNKEFLAKIGVELLAFFYSHNGWKHGMDILFALEENQLNSYLTMKLDDQAMDVSIMAVETALYKMHPSFAVGILNRCFSGQICGAMFLSSSLPVKKFKHCLHLFRVLVDQLLNKNMREEILELMRVTLEKCPGLRDSLQETGDLASSTICRILNDKEVKIAEELFKLSCDYRLPVQPLVVRALLVGCSEVRWSTKVADLFTFCQRNIYSKQNVEELPRSVQIDALLSEVEMRLIIEDYLYQVYRILCDKRARQIPYDEGEFHLHIMVTSSIDPYTEHTYLPTCRPNAVHRAKESLLSILHEHFKFQAHVAMPRVIRVSPESVQQYFIVLDGSRAAPQRPVPLHPVAPHPLPPHPAVPPIQGRVPMGRAHGEMAGYPGGVRPGRRRPRSLHPRGRGPGYIRPHEKPRYPPAGNN